MASILDCPTSLVTKVYRFCFGCSQELEFLDLGGLSDFERCLLQDVLQDLDQVPNSKEPLELATAPMECKQDEYIEQHPGNDEINIYNVDKGVLHICNDSQLEDC